MAFGYVDGDKLVLFTCRRDLGYGKGRRGSWWALIAFSAMADFRTEFQYPLTKWVFPLEIKLAVERILNQRKANFELMNEEQCTQRVSEVMKAQEEERHLKIRELSTDQFG
jgi:hypothetical protein